MTPRLVVLELTRIEAAHLAHLVAQFLELLSAEASSSTDPALTRLTPAAYPDDESAAREFRAATRDDLLQRRRDDAEITLTSLGFSVSSQDGTVTLDPDPNDDLEPPRAIEEITIALAAEEAQAWMRTLAAVRLVLAERLQITETTSVNENDPRVGIYEWLGFRLDGLVAAIDEPIEPGG